MNVQPRQCFQDEMVKPEPRSNLTVSYRDVLANWYPSLFRVKSISMHPSNTLLLPTLHRFSERLLRAQIEAHAKELNPDDRGRFLEKQLGAVYDAISEKLSQSYNNAPILTAWEPKTVQESVKCWVLFLSGEANFMLGIPDFTLGAMLVELGRPLTFTGVSPATQTEMHGHYNEGVFVNGYRVRRTLAKVRSELCVVLGPERYQAEDLGKFQYVRQSGDELADSMLVLGGRADRAFGEPGDQTLKALITQFMPT